MRNEFPPTLRNLVRYQAGVISRSQAVRGGLSPGMIKFRVSSGRWRQIHPGIYATFTGVPSRGARLWAAVLWAGPGASLSHETAAELHRLTDQLAEVIHLTVPVQRRVVAVSGVVIHRSARALEAVEGYTNPPRTKVEETVLDLTQTARTFDDVCGWVTRAFARDLTDETRLRKAMSVRTNGRHARPPRRWPRCSAGMAGTGGRGLARPAVPSSRDRGPVPSASSGRSRSTRDGRDHQGGVGQVGQHGVRTGRGELCAGETAGRDAHRAGARGQGRLHVQRRVADENGR
jgi:hypothetical protein